MFNLLRTYHDGNHNIDKHRFMNLINKADLIIRYSRGHGRSITGELLLRAIISNELHAMIGQPNKSFN